MLLPPSCLQCASSGRPKASIERRLRRPLCFHSATTRTLGSAFFLPALFDRLCFHSLSMSKGVFHGTWWRHQMETFSALLAICAGNSPVPGEFPAQRPVTRFDVFFDLRPNKRLSKQWRGWWFETQSRSLWRHRNEAKRSLERYTETSLSGFRRPSSVVAIFLVAQWWHEVRDLGNLGIILWLFSIIFKM